MCDHNQARGVSANACTHTHRYAADAHILSVPVQIVCVISRAIRRRCIIVSCQGDIARELELLTHMDITACQEIAWTIQVSLQTSLALINNNSCKMALISLQ